MFERIPRNYRLRYRVWQDYLATIQAPIKYMHLVNSDAHALPCMADRTPLELSSSALLKKNIFEIVNLKTLSIPSVKCHRATNKHFHSDTH